MAKLTGGGILGNKNVNVGVKTGASFKNRVSPGGVSEIGSAIGSTVKPGSLGNSYGGTSAAQRVMDGRVKHPTPMGNAVAVSTRPGPGGSRTVYACGTQSAPSNRSMPKGRDILSSFGPDLSGRGSKR
jgi:hypothetical protein